MTRLKMFIITLAILSFAVKSDGKKYGTLSFTEEPNDLHFLNTIKSELKCHASGTPIPKITWLNSDGDVVTPVPNLLSITDNRLIFHTFHSNQYKLAIHNTTYRCKASNYVGSVLSQNAKVTADIDAKYSPVVYHQSASVGGRAIFKCHIPTKLSSYIKIYSWKLLAETTRSVMTGTSVDSYTVLQTGELIVSNIKKSLNGYKFSCVSVNILNNATIASSSATLYVNDPTFYPPENIISPVNQNVMIGDPIILNCQVSSFPLPHYIWLKDGKLLSNSKYKTILGGSIEISDVEISDGGVYTCVINNTKYSYSAVVEVIEPLRFFQTPESIYDSPNNIAQFNCNATGSLPANIIWYHNGKEVHRNERTSFSSMKDILTLVNLEVSDEGLYQCSINNKFDQIHAVAQLVVSSTIPTIMHVSEDAAVDSNSVVTINCTSTGLPTPRISWLFADSISALKPSSFISIKETLYNSSTLKSTLTLRKISTNMSATYKCIAENHVGSDVKQINLKVNGIPAIVNFVDKEYGRSEERLYLHCNARGSPQISFTWLKWNNEISVNDAATVAYPNGTLLIKSFKQWENRGNYTCKASNEHGTDERTTFVDLIDPPSIGSIDFSPVLASTREKFLCQCTRGSNMGLKITWYKDGVDVKNIPGVDVKEVDPFTTLLSFSNVKPDDHGYYTCVAENIAGKTSSSGSLIVLERASFVIPPQDKSVLYGHPATLSCHVSGFPQPQITWYKRDDQGNNFHLLQLNHRVKQLHNGTLFFSVTQASDGGVYYCEASSYSNLPNLNSKEVDLKVRVPAKIIRTSEPMARQAKGKSLEIMCSVTGTPPLAVKWFKTGVIITDKQNKYIMTSQPNTSVSKHFLLNATLLIVGLSREDNAYYECMGSNEYGSNKATFRLLVEEKPYEPRSITKTSSASKFISLSWKPDFDGNQPILNYVIEVCEDEECWEKAKTYKVNGNITEYTISGLRPGSFYQFRIKAQNKIGISEYSEVKTLATNEEAPSGPPTKIVVKAVQKDQILVTWQPPSKALRNGMISQYLIHYTSTSTLRPVQEKTITVPSVARHTLIGLYQYTGYKVKIQAMTKVGKGPLSKPFYATTLEGVPSAPPSSIKIHTLSSRNIFVSWDAIPELYRNGALEGYIVKFTDIEMDLGHQVKVKDSLDVTLKNLKTHTKYKICVMGYTKAGLGATSQCYEKWTFEDVPEAPTHFKAIPANPVEIVLTWQPPVNTNGVLLNYVIYYKREGGNREVHFSVLAEKTTYSVDKLRVKQRYTFRMTAKTSKGEGNSTAEISAITAEHVPAKIITPDRLTILKPIGSDVSLPCTAVGYPKPSVSWQSRSNDFNRGRRWMAEDKPKLLYRITKETEGEYVCTASNQYGKDENVVILKVQVPPSPPQNVIAEIENSAKRRRRSTYAEDLGPDRYTLKIRWTPNDNGNSKILHHVVYHAIKNQDSDWIISKLRNDQHWFRFENITTLTVYFKVASQNGVGLGGFTPAYQFDIVPATEYTPASVHFTVVSRVFDNNNDEDNLKKLLKPILISSVAFITILIVLLLVASWDREERRITGPKCNRLCCSCLCWHRPRKAFNTDPYGEPHLPWPWNINRNRHSGAFELKDERLIPGSPQGQMEMQYRDDTALNYNVVDDADHRNSFRRDFEPVVIYTGDKTPDFDVYQISGHDNFTYGRNPLPANENTYSSPESISRTSGRFHRKYPQPDPYYSEQSLIEKYLESQNEYDTDSYTNRYADQHPNVELISLPDETVYNSLEKRSIDINGRGSADGKPVDLPGYDELYGKHPGISPPQYGEQDNTYTDYSDAPRALFRSGENGSIKRKKNRKSLDSLLLKTLEDIEEQAILGNNSNNNAPAVEKHAAIVRESLRDTTRSYDSISSTCSSSVGELRRAFEFGKKYGLQQPADLPPYLHDSMCDLTADDISDDDQEFIESAKLLNMLDLTNFSEKPKSVNDIKFKLPLPVRLNDTDDDDEEDYGNSEELELSEYGKPGMPALSLV